MEENLSMARKKAKRAKKRTTKRKSITLVLKKLFLYPLLEVLLLALIMKVMRDE